MKVELPCCPPEMVESMKAHMAKHFDSTRYPLKPLGHFEARLMRVVADETGLYKETGSNKTREFSLV